ncbi:MAG: hypothetical protein HZA20_00860 [Nitrospirae bacterium]|nr:hypothetical protein [Nitrospirota bacterium]
MLVDYKERILREIEKIPPAKLVDMYRIVHILSNEMATYSNNKSLPSLKGIWKGNRIDDSVIAEARESLYPYETK